MRPNYLIPEVRSFIQQLYREVPHFFYFLATEPIVGPVNMHALCLLAMSDLSIQGDRAMPKSYSQLVQLMVERLKLAVEFARRIGDDAEDLFLSFQHYLPDEYRSSVRKQVLS